MIEQGKSIQEIREKKFKRNKEVVLEEKQSWVYYVLFVVTKHEPRIRRRYRTNKFPIVLFRSARAETLINI